MELFPKEPFQTQHLFAIIADCQIDLYLGQGEAALARLQAHWKKIQRGRLPNVPFFNATKLYLRARAHLAASQADKALEDCALIEAEKAPWAHALAGSVRAALAPEERRPAELLAAAEACDRHGLQLVAAACRFRSDEPEAHEQARRWLDGQGVRAPGRLVRVFLP